MRQWHSAVTERRTAEQQTRATPLRRRTSSNTFLNRSEGHKLRCRANNAGRGRRDRSNHPRDANLRKLGLRGDGMVGRSEIVLPDNAARRTRCLPRRTIPRSHGEANQTFAFHAGKPVDFAAGDDLAAEVLRIGDSTPWQASAHRSRRLQFAVIGLRKSNIPNARGVRDGFFFTNLRQPRGFNRRGSSSADAT